MRFPNINKITVFSFFTAIFVSGITSVQLGNDASWDLLNYHYYNGYAFLTNRLGYDIAPAQVQTYLNPLLDMFVYLGISYLKPAVFCFILGALQGIGIWLVFLLTFSMTKQKYSQKISFVLATLAAVTAFRGAGWFSELGATFGDNIVSIFVLAALLIIVVRPVPISLPDGKFALTGACLLLGIASGLKLVTAIYFIGFIISLAFMIDSRQMLKVYMLAGIAFCVGFTASMGFWMINLWNKFHSPLFPFYNKLFRSHYYEFTNFSDTRFLPRTNLQKLFYPIFFTKDSQLVCELSFRDYRLLVLYLVVFLFLALSIYIVIVSKTTAVKTIITDHRKHLFLMCFCLISYVLWQKMFSIYRYIIVLELLTPIIIIIFVGLVWQHKRIGAFVSIVILILLIITVKPIDWGRLPWGNTFFSFTTTSPLEKYNNTTIVMSGDNPTSYVIPFFPENTRFIRIKSNFNNPTRKTKMTDEINNAIRQAPNLKMFLSQDNDDLESAKNMGIFVNKYSCDLISSSIGINYFICDASLMN